MHKTLFLLFLLCHMLGDYYFQSRNLAEEKKENYAAILKHSGIYALVFLVGSVVFWSWQITLTAFVLALLHWLIDTIKYWIGSRCNAKQSAVLYGCDQLAHLLCILIAVSMMKHFTVSLSFAPWLQFLKAYLPADSLTSLQWLCLLFFIVNPARFTVKELLLPYKPDSTASKAKSDANTGAIIGTLERMIIILLLSIQQYSAIGLVLTAKSIARYDQLKNQDFAEYYLIGTLLSALLAIGAYLFLFNFL